MQAGSVRFWKRYVDDVCCTVEKSSVSSLLSHLNSIESSIQFTCEVEKDRTLPFLDVLLHHNLDGSISTRVYRKPSNTGRYLDFSSHHPPSQKAAIVKTLFSRAKALSSSQEFVRDECFKIQSMLHQNNYPMKFVNRRFPSSSKSLQVKDKKKTRFAVIPYVQGLSEAIKRILSPLDIQVSFQPHTNLRKMLSRVKDPTPTLQKSNVVYCIPCDTCHRVYIGQTSRLLKTRIDEHKRAVKFARIEESAVAEHIWVSKHQINFQSVAVLAHERNLHLRLMLESWYIRKLPTINREKGVLPATYGRLF